MHEVLYFYVHVCVCLYDYDILILKLLVTGQYISFWLTAYEI